MSIKFWDDEKDERVFVRFDQLSPSGSPVWLCRENGAWIDQGNLVHGSGERAIGVDRRAARIAGVEMDGGQISADSLAQICAEMAKRIQGD